MIEITRRPRIVFVSGEPHTPGHHYRILNVASALPPAEYETVVLRADELRRRMAELAELDLLWIWRAPRSRRLAAAIGAARSAGARVVFDMDDLLFRPELNRAQVIDGNRQLGPARRAAASWQYRNLRTTLVLADHCTAPTEPLAREMRALGKPTTVVPNGFDAAFLRVAREVESRSEPGADEGVIRIGYAAGTLTHQRDLSLAVPALARVLAEHREVRFVCFEGGVDLREFPELNAEWPQIELRPLVPLDDLPREYARFDVSIAPLEVGNEFCEAKSELKYFEAALAGAVTVASPTEPFAGAIQHGETGFLAPDERSWYESLSLLVRRPDVRRRAAAAARSDVLWRFGPERRSLLLGRLVDELLVSRPVVSASG